MKVIPYIIGLIRKRGLFGTVTTTDSIELLSEYRLQRELSTSTKETTPYTKTPYTNTPDNNLTTVISPNLNYSISVPPYNFTSIRMTPVPTSRATPKKNKQRNDVSSKATPTNVPSKATKSQPTRSKKNTSSKTKR